MRQNFMPISFLILLLSLSSEAQENNRKSQFDPKLTDQVTVVELFTSQGCHSCPPADAFLGELKKQPDTIALSCHVTYWNYLGWKDTFSNEFCDNRQRRYQSQLLTRPGVYTPQMVINGQYGVVGSQKKQIHQLIDYTQNQDRVNLIRMELADNDKLRIELPELEINGEVNDKGENTQSLILFATSGTHDLNIPRGENGGKTLTYHNPVGYTMNLGTWNGESKVITPSIDLSLGDEWVLIAQKMPLGAISAAGALQIN